MFWWIFCAPMNIVYIVPRREHERIWVVILLLPNDAVNCVKLDRAM